jgi:hypothetical protein
MDGKRSFVSNNESLDYSVRISCGSTSNDKCEIQMDVLSFESGNQPFITFLVCAFQMVHRTDLPKLDLSPLT